MKIKDWLMLLAVGGAAWFVYSKLSGGLDDIANAAKKIKEWLAMPPQVKIKGMLVFENGKYISFSNLKTYWFGEELRVNYNGKTYRIFPHDDRGNYPAVEVTPIKSGPTSR